MEDESQTPVSKEEFYKAQLFQRNKIKETDSLIQNLKQHIEKNGPSVEINAIVGKIPLLCLNVLNIHEMLKELRDGQEKINSKLDDKFVTKDGTFWVIRTIVFTGAGAVLLAVLSAILYKIGLVLK